MEEVTPKLKPEGRVSGRRREEEYAGRGNTCGKAWRRERIWSVWEAERSSAVAQISMHKCPEGFGVICVVGSQMHKGPQDESFGYGMRGN